MNAAFGNLNLMLDTQVNFYIHYHIDMITHGTAVGEPVGKCYTPATSDVQAAHSPWN